MPNKHNLNPKPKPTDRLNCEFCGDKIMNHLLYSHQKQKPSCISIQIEKLGQPIL